MAFSTQKDFFRVPSAIRQPVSECQRASVKMKSYGSAADISSWANDQNKQSKYLKDLVTCEVAAVDDRDEIVEHHNSIEDDLPAAYEQLEKAAVKPLNLENQFANSNTQHESSSEENQKMQIIFQAESNINKNSIFYNKIKNLIDSNQMDKIDKADLMKFCNETEALREAYANMQTEICYLRTLNKINMQNAAVENINREQETSYVTVTSYLQTCFNSLHKNIFGRQVTTQVKNSSQAVQQKDVNKSETSHNMEPPTLSKQQKFKQIQSAAEHAIVNKLVKNIELTNYLQKYFAIKQKGEHEDGLKTIYKPKSGDSNNYNPNLELSNVSFIDEKFHNQTAQVSESLKMTAAAIIAQNKHLTAKLDKFEARLDHLNESINESITETKGISKKVEESMHLLRGISAGEISSQTEIDCTISKLYTENS